ncbi:TetR/AcrR family transcriptional regulator [Actinomycetospora sp. NBRC 106375]|uniref:TetR/AcrR family transcriptional regulator n=1 Tax=Actinomycetospora sp. NBRC 106375 TaxID=3032207 RepID=UPI002552B8CD|nr:TetR/AcrR family transcriptional regulator [Actinomycetospora sp. NBRC 106375]
MEPVGRDKRVARSQAAVLAATYELMLEGGLAGVSVDEVSRRCGVAKTTIYRHWPSRSALLLDACSQMGTAVPVPDTGGLAGDLHILVEGLADQLRAPGWPAILPSIIDAAERDPDLARAHAELHRSLMDPFLDAVEQARRRGDIRGDRDPTAVVASLVGPLFYRRWFSREPLDAAFVDQVLDVALDVAGAAARQGSTSGGGARSGPVR